MKNLQGQDLKDSFKKEITTALKKIKNPCAKIRIIFTDKNEVIDTERIDLKLGSIYYKKVNLDTLSKNQKLDLIVNNMHYDHFSYITTRIKIGKIECHGFGDYWGEDLVVIRYHRYEE